MSAPPQAQETPKVTLEGGTKLSRALQVGQTLRIGQAQSAHLRIPHPSVAPVHCELNWDGANRVTLKIPGPEIKLSINGTEVSGSCDLKDGDMLQLGLFQIRVSIPLVAEVQTAPPPVAKAVTQENAGAMLGLPPVLWKGERVNEVKVEDGIVFGTGSEANVLLEGLQISSRHASIVANGDGFDVVDSGEVGSLINGKYFERHTLTIGDFLAVGNYWFVFDGYALRQVSGATGSGIKANGLAVERRDGGYILSEANFETLPGEFVGILGPSGAGKTTLLKALCALSKVAGGEVLVDGVPLEEYTDLSEVLGFVPQQEIVHLDLTSRQALYYSALLRLPARTPLPEVNRLILMLATRLGLAPHLDTRARNLSGGQLKRLSVCVELLKRPRLLFLDEPTSGLDPESETELMQQLQELTFTGCTVVATTHVMENVYLMNRVQVVMAGRDEATGKALPGTTVFSGRPREAREFFEVQSLGRLYARLRDKPRDEWRSLAAASAKSITAPPISPPVKRAPLPRRFSLPILLRRHWSLLMADKRSLLLLVGQPLLIALLIAFTAVGTTESATKLFLAVIATLWLGCSNSATEIVGESTIFRREQFVGLSTFQYLLSKFAGLGALSALQALMLLTVLNLAGTGLAGSLAWQGLCLICCAFAATGIGLALSAWAKTGLQAVLLVPVVIIPQILFGGYVFPVKDWNDALFPRAISRVMPSFAAQRMMDTSLLWNEPISDYLDMEDKGLRTSYDNLTTTIYPMSALIQPSKNVEYTVDESKLYKLPADADPAEKLGPAPFSWSLDSPPVFRLGVIYHHAAPVIGAAFQLLFWTLLSFVLAMLPLARRRPA